MVKTPSINALSSRRRCAFTLVEILVVMAIVALLAAMLLPAVGRSKAQAKLISCRNRLRNVGVGLRMYTDEREGLLPVGTCVDGPQPELTEALSGSYVQDVRNFYCPSEIHPLRRYTSENAEKAQIGYFYYACREPSKNRDVSGFLRIDANWPRPLSSTMDADIWVMSDCWFRGESTPHRHYKKGMNYLTLSGVVQFLEKSPRSSFK